MLVPKGIVWFNPASTTGKALTVRVASADRSLLTEQFVASHRYLKVPVAVMPDTPRVAVVAFV
jgi:hypothetical protein